MRQPECQGRAPRKGVRHLARLGARASKRFALALVVRTLEGQSSFTEAFRLLGLQKMVTFQELGHSLRSGLLIAGLSGKRNAAPSPTSEALPKNRYKRLLSTA